MSMALQARVSMLEAEVRSLAARLDAMAKPNGEHKEPVNPNGPRKMCPHCGVKLAYHLHVKNCKGPWQA
jgi:hypothetical protein